MRMYELLALVILLPLFSALSASNFRSLAECEKNYAEKSAPYNADRCIVASFRRICSQSASQRQNFDAFVKNYGSVLPVTSFLVETVGIKDNKKLMKCSWISSGRENYVLAVCGEKEDL